MTRVSIVVRTARAEDSDALAEVHIQARNAYYRGFVAEEDLDRRADELREVYRGMSGRGDRTLLCAQRGDTIVGMALLGTPHDPEFEPARAGQLHQLHVHPDHWRQGVGSRLHDVCVRTWQQLSLSIAVLEVWDRNDRARSFYTAHDWEPDGHSRPGPGNTRYLRLRRTL